ncbi:MAG TPA: oligosaccharide flippase family protein, partial [Blastocatellia bacterium]
MGLVAKKVETKKESDSAAPLFDRTVGAFTWRFLSESSTFALRLLVTVVLARLLPVDAFGLVTLAMIVVNFAFRVSQIGMGPALIQRKDLTETHIRVAFTVSILSGILLTTVIWAAAPFAAAAFRNPSVTPVLRLISISFLFSSLGTTAESLIERKLDYRKLFKLEMTSYSIGYALTGVALALLGFGVWALAWATVIESILR